MNDEREYFTVEQIAEQMQVHERTVRNWIAHEGLPAFPIGKRGYRISKGDLQAFIERRKIRPAPETEKER